ncbi:tripartite motif-containing protein 2 [Nematolebias whitei]|uniref:tripartite motif-containing protein 2 n=1 Tax=Nematolebias whitei TaxID=451745 RepID=UPI00189ABDAF|nr:tripartite motif-containing protein 2 [Nematolebias whitei]
MEAHQHSPDSSSEECTVLEVPPSKNTCPQHAGKVADLYCPACECALCEDCVSDHIDHPKILLSEALEQNRSQLQERLEAIQGRLPQICDALSFVKEIVQQLSSQRTSIEEDIQSSFEDLHKQLDVRKSVLLMELEVTYGLKQKVQKHTKTKRLCLIKQLFLHSLFEGNPFGVPRPEEVVVDQERVHHSGGMCVEFL